MNSHLIETILVGLVVGAGSLISLYVISQALYITQGHFTQLTQALN